MKMTLKRLLIVLCLITMFHLTAEEYCMENGEISYDMDFMADGDSYKGEDYDKYLNTIAAEKNFLRGCEKLQDLDGLTGNWMLVDRNGNYHNICQYSLCSDIESKYYNGYIVINCYDRNSNIYKSQSGRYFIWVNWMNIVRMIELKDEKLYFYVTQDDKWVLDPIHKNGDYYFIKKK